MLMPYKAIDRKKLESIARNWSMTALKTLAGIMINTSAKDCDRIRAAEIILNRGWGKPTERAEFGEGALVRNVDSENLAHRFDCFKFLFHSLFAETFATQSANRRHHAHSFDHLVGAAEQRKRDGESERPGGLEVEDQLDFCGLLNR
jgi:hypothetical protein